MLRLSSHRVESSIGSSRVRNPKKGFGPQQHGLVSLLTGLYLGGQIPKMNKGTVESVKCLMVAVGKATGEVNLEEHMAGKIPNIVALDRGYLYDEVLKVLCLYGCTLIGTLKRCFLAPFVYGTARKFAHQTIVPEQGPKLSLYARQCVATDGEGNPVLSIVGIHRNGTGSCFMTHTTSSDFSPEKWAYVPRETAMRAQQSDTFHGPFETLQQTCRLLTSSQRSVDWHVFRLFRVTSTAAVSLFRTIAKRSSVQEMEQYAYILNFLGIRSNNFQHLLNMDIELEEVDDLPEETFETLMGHRKEQLRDMCQIRNLKYGRNKTDLVTRLIRFHCNVVIGNTDLEEEIAHPLLGGLMASWMMKPKMTTSMKVGALNEVNILPRIGKFWADNFPPGVLHEGEVYKWGTYTEYGLLANKTNFLFLLHS